MKWKDMLASAEKDEMAGHDKYMEIARVANEEGCCHMAGILRDMAAEEESHSRMVHKMLAELPEE